MPAANDAGQNEVDATPACERNDAAGQLHDNAVQEEMYAVSEQSIQQTPNAPTFEARTDETRD
jgi:hypothetical protein